MLGDSTDSESSFRFEQYKHNKTCFKRIDEVLKSANVTMFMPIGGD